MKQYVIFSRHTWLCLLTALLLLLAPTKALADMDFGEYCEVKHSPTMAEPWIELRVCWYDTNGWNAGFAGASPDLYIDNRRAFTLEKLALDFDDDAEDWFEDERQIDEWWGDEKSTIIDGNMWRVRLWDPSKKGGRYYAHLFITPAHYFVGVQHTFSIEGWWYHHGNPTIGERQSKEWKFYLSPSWKVTQSTMSEYGKVKLSGTLDTRVTNKTYVGVTTPEVIAQPYLSNSSTLDRYPLDNMMEFSAGTESFTDKEFSYERKNFYERETAVVLFKSRKDYTIHNVAQTGYYYENFNVSLPGYVRAKNIRAKSDIADMWEGRITLQWDADDSDERMKDGTWRVYRYNGDERKLLAQNLAYNEREVVDDKDELEYETNYKYDVVFVPAGSPVDVEREELTQSFTTQIERDFNFNELVASNTYEDKIVFTWSHNSIYNANNKQYRLYVQRSLDGVNWTDVKEISITNRNITEGKYEDTDHLESWQRYYYRLKINCLGREYISDDVWGILYGMSYLTAFSASRGTYRNVVKLRWDAKQVGTGTTYYTVSRRPLGSNDDDEWIELTTLSGTASSYSYDDETALPGSFNQYRVLAWTMHEGERFDGSETMTDGFSLTTGTISGRITYGTGTAVQGARVTLKQNNTDGEVVSAMRSLRLSGANSGVMYNTTNKSITNLLGKDFSVQLYVNPNSAEMDSDDVAYRLFDVDQTFGITMTRNEGDYLLGAMFGGGAVQSSTVDIPADRWSHITCVYNKTAQTATFYVAEADTLRTGDALTGTVTASADADAIRVAYLPDVEQPTFQGYVDEFRFFTKALSENDILKNYNHPLSGSEGSLAIYYPLDEGLQAQTIAYDFSKSNGVANGRHGVMKVAATSSTYVPSETQLSLMGYTDEEGNYVVRGVPFSGEGTNYTIIPSFGIHEFSPSYLSRYVSMSSLNHSGVDFEDVSSFPVSGKIMYAGTDYPVEGVQFYVDGNLCTREGNMIESAEDGTFTISVPIGDHSIRVEKSGHVFAANGRYPADPLGVGTKITFDREIKNLEFVDETLVNFSGRVVGGVVEGEKPVGFGQSVNNIGVTELVLTPLNDRYRMNVVKNVTETSYSYDTNQEEVNVESATERIHSTAHRGAGADHCRQIYIQTDPETGEFSAMLPPLLYQVQSMKVVKSGLSVGEPLTIDLSNPNIELTDTLTTEDGTEELYNYNTLLRQVYHSEPTFTVTQEDHDDGAFGIDTYELEDAIGKLTVDDIYSVGDDGKVNYKYGGPVFVMCDPYTFLIEGYEEYTNEDADAPIRSDRVPLQDVVVTIDNALSISQEVYGEDGAQPGQVVELQSNQLALDSLGQATYKWKAGLPNIVEPYTRTISISYEIDDRVYQWSGSGMAGIILGDMPTGNNFVTAGPDLIDMILRDPPGSQSKTEWKKGTVRNKFHNKGGVWNWDNKTTVTKHFGFQTTIGKGVGAFTLDEVKSDDDLKLGFHMVSEGENTDTWSRTVTTERAVSTTDDPGFVGADGDVFIGSSTNLLFGMSRQVNFHRNEGTNEVVLDLRDAMTMGMEYGTEFMYTQRYIKNELIPNYKMLRNSKLITVPDVSAVTNDTDKPIYVTTLSPDDEKFGSSNHDKNVWDKEATSAPSSEGPSYKMIVPAGSEVAWQDSIEWMNSQIAIWEEHLEFNEKQKVDAYNKRTELQSKGKAHNYSIDSGTGMTFSSQTAESDGYVHDNKFTCVSVVANQFGFAFNQMGYTMEIENELGGGTHWVEGWENQESASFEYTFNDDANTEAMDEYNDAISVDVYEYDNYGPIFRTLGGQTSKPYEGQVVTEYYEPGTVIMEATMQIEKPQIDVDVPVVSDIPSGSAANFTLRLGNASETGTDVSYKLMVDDTTNPDGAIISIDGKALGEGQMFLVPAGETLTKSLQLKQSNSSILDYEGIKLIFCADFEPDVIFDDVSISAHFVPSSSPVTLDLSNTLMNTQTGTDLTLTFRDFDRTYRGLKAFRLQFKKQGASDWTLLHEYVVDKANVTNNNELLPASGASVSYTLPMAAYSDGQYQFRVLSVSTYGTAEITLPSNELTLIKDMDRPRPLGQPEPTDGILEIGDELSVTYNDNFLKGELTKEANFRVTGVLNGAPVDHETALRLNNTSDAAAATETSIVLAGKDFSTDMWIKLDGKGTILSHGQGSTKLNVGTDAAGYLTVSMEGEKFTSINTIPTDKWVFLTLSYQNTDNGGELRGAVASDDETFTLFDGQPVPAYRGNGPLSVGSQISGAIHELLLWDEAHDISSALLQRSRTKSPATPHLIGYWKMNEGEGTVITDYSRNRHMKMQSDNWYLNNENKAVEIGNQSWLAINASELPLFSADDYAIEFWVRGDQQGADVQLLQMGDIALWTTAEGTLQLTGQGAYLPLDQQQSYTTSATNLLDNNWHHVALNVLRQGAASVYVDGKRSLTTSAKNVGSIATNVMLVGAQRTTFNAEEGEYEYGRYFNGQVDELRVWNATLNADQLARNSHIRLTGSEDGLVAYYPFETKKLDDYSQVVTVGTDADLTGSSHTAQLMSLNAQPSPPTYIDEAPALRTKPTETNVSFNYTASDNKIVIDIDEDAAAIEGCTLNFVVRDLRDANGNYSVPAIWSAYVSRNQLAWDEDEINLTIPQNTGATITSTILNKGGQQQLWTLSGLPQWLKASTESGQTNPQAETAVTFTIDKSTPVGIYETTIYLTGNDDIATPLTINVKVKGEEPAWTVNPNDYEHTMSIMATLDITGTPSSDSDDLVGVFIDDVCRGTAHLEYRSRYDNHFATIVVYGNNEDAGKPLQFKCYDASTGVTYPVAKASLNGAECQPSFEPSAVVGRYSAPLQLSAVDVTEQEINLSRGWNWISLGIVTDDMSVPALFGDNTDIESIKSKNAFMEYDGEWLGRPMTLNSSSMYMVQAAAPTTVKLTGSRVEAQTSPIVLKAGWNWIGYNQLGTMSLDDALAGWNVQPDDIIKSQRGAAYYDEFEWVGSLGAMEPGKGYMIYSTTDCQFNYPSATVFRAPSRSRNFETSETSQTLMFSPIDPSLYEGNMVVVAQVVDGSIPVADAEVGFFADEECRQAAVTDSEGRFCITVPGSVPCMLTIRISDGQYTYRLPQTISYVTDTTCGAPRAPFVIDLGTATGITELSDSHEGSNTDTIYDLSGRKINKADSLKKGVYIINGQKKTKR